MTPSYQIDTSKYSLQQMKADLLSRKLIPSRRPLLVDLEGKFQSLEQAGLRTLGDLIFALKDTKKLNQLASVTGIDEGYLNLLRREANSYIPKPIPLDRMKGIDSKAVEMLAVQGIKNSRHLFERAADGNSIAYLSELTGISLDTLEHLLSLSDLGRAYGVGPVFAELLYDAGIHSLQEFRSYTPDEIIQLYKERTGKQADFTLSDLQFSLDIARMLEVA